MRITGIYIMVFLLIALASCSKSPGGAPQFMDEEDVPSPSGSSEVDDRMALEVGLKKLIYHVGPVDIPAGMPADEMLEKPLVMNFQTDEPVWAVGFAPRVVDSKGNELPRELLRFAIVSNMHEENPLCSDAGGGNPFVASTGTLKEINLPQGYGYPILPTDPLEAKVVFQNESREAYVDVFFEVALLVRPMGELANLKDVKPMLVEVDACKHSTVSVAPGEFSDFTATYQMPEASSLIVAYGVIQDYGTAVELSAQDEAAPFWRAEAAQDENHRIISLTGDPFEDPAGVQFGEGDSITIGVEYDNTSKSWVDAATAAAMVFVTPKE